jgi:hypothetical protein
MKLKSENLWAQNRMQSYFFARLWVSSSVSWSPWRTLLILSDGWEYTHTQVFVLIRVVHNRTFITGEIKKQYLVRASAVYSGRRVRRSDLRPGEQIRCGRLPHGCASLHSLSLSLSLSLRVYVSELSVRLF